MPRKDFNNSNCENREEMSAAAGVLKQRLRESADGAFGKRKVAIRAKCSKQARDPAQDWGH